MTIIYIFSNVNDNVYRLHLGNVTDNVYRLHLTKYDKIWNCRKFAELTNFYLQTSKFVV